MVDFQKFVDAFLKGEIEEGANLTELYISQGKMAPAILQKGLIAAMDVVGQKFKMGELYIPEVLMAARVMQAGMDVLKPELIKSNAAAGPKILMGTVQGDVHDIGKNLVGMMLKGAGFEVVDIGVDVVPEKFVEAMKTHQPRVLGLSALLTTTMPQMKTTLNLLKEAGLLEGVKAIVGGAPVTQAFASKIGADGYAPDASTAVDKVRELLSY
jgi:5-methyltetrahydrofolate--homocysteine methyltransferase